MAYSTSKRTLDSKTLLVAIPLGVVVVLTVAVHMYVNRTYEPEYLGHMIRIPKQSPLGRWNTDYYLFNNIYPREAVIFVKLPKECYLLNNGEIQVTKWSDYNYTEVLARGVYLGSLKRCKYLITKELEQNGIHDLKFHEVNKYSVYTLYLDEYSTSFSFIADVSVTFMQDVHMPSCTRFYVKFGYIHDEYYKRLGGS